MGDAVPAGGQWLRKPLRRRIGLVFVQSVLIPDAQPVLENGRALVAVGVVSNVVHAA